MKRKSDVLLSCFAALLILAACSNTPTEETEFWVRGNCDMCKERIEETLNADDGVQSASYDLETKMVKVSYDPVHTSREKLELAVAGVGHSTKQHVASRQVHDALPDCCQEGAGDH